MQLVSNEINTDNAAYTLERAIAFGRSAPELHSLLGSFGLFLSKEADTTPINEWIDDADNTLVKDDPRITLAQQNLTEIRRDGNPDMEHHAVELSRSTEWLVLLEKFISVVPVNAESAA